MIANLFMAPAFRLPTCAQKVAILRRLGRQHEAARQHGAGDRGTQRGDAAQVQHNDVGSLGRPELSHQQLDEGRENRLRAGGHTLDPQQEPRCVGKAAQPEQGEQGSAVRSHRAGEQRSLARVRQIYVAGS